MNEDDTRDDNPEWAPFDDDAATAVPDPDAVPRRVIRFEASNPSPAIHQAIEALAQRGGTFVGGNGLVQLVGASVEDQARSSWVDQEGAIRYAVRAGTPRIAPLALPVLAMRMTEAAQFRKFDGRSKEFVPCAPPSSLVAAVHELGDWNLPRITGVAETPILRTNGTIASARGYDVETEYFIAPNDEFPPVPAEPSQADARTAYLALAEVFEDFPFAHADQIAVPVAAVLTLIARAALPMCSVPGFIFDAGAGGCGKTLITDAISVITNGRPASRTGYPASDEECGKVLAGYAMRGAPLISVDDVKRALGGENLDRTFTARGEVDFRVLGQTEIKTMPWRSVLFFTGVNVTCTGQIPRRVLVARIESTLERPQDRTDVKHPMLLAWLKAERPRLVIAALTLLRAYFAKGSPDAGCKTWGSFEEWSRLIPHAIKFAGGPDVLACRPPDDDPDMTSDAGELHDVLRGLTVLAERIAPRLGRKPSDGLSTGEIAAALFKASVEEDASFRDALRSMTGVRGHADPTPVQIGMRFARMKGRVMRVKDASAPTGKTVRLGKVKCRLTSDMWRVEVVGA